MDEEGKEARAAGDVADQRRQDHSAERLAEADLTGEERQEGLGGAGDDMREVAMGNRIGQHQDDGEVASGDAGADPGDGSDQETPEPGRTAEFPP
ncbi:hypothetical protein JMJ56_23990 [Belnapia sp. T18]|uniref:Uncharacterized protein n=1 Tax=Belnapia arida TaxID=2804533 RepID=A0ABS1U8T4_9PROT|nr:hypothetical protein [Belnapia arida]MBL6081079.1 hypothetical protein [Belnapia arida]